MRNYLFSNRTSNGAGDWIPFKFSKPDAELIISGNLDGGTLVLQQTIDQGDNTVPVNYSNGDTASFTETGSWGGIQVSWGDELRASVSGGGGDLDITVAIQSLYE